MIILGVEKVHRIRGGAFAEENEIAVLTVHVGESLSRSVKKKILADSPQSEIETSAPRASGQNLGAGECVLLRHWGR